MCTICRKILRKHCLWGPIYILLSILVGQAILFTSKVYRQSISQNFWNVNKAAKLSFFTANQGRSFFRDSLFRHLKTEIELGNGRKINLPELLG